MAGERPLQGKVAFITGASRGIGKEIVLNLAEAGAVVVGNSVDPKKQRRVDQTIAQASERGGRIEWVFGDISSIEDQARMVYNTQEVARSVKGGEKTVDYVFLNAAGGLEQDKPDNWARTINVDSQMALVGQFTPSMARGGAFVDLISLWSERFGDVEQLPFYRPVAKTKHAGERHLRGLIPTLAERDIRMLFLNGNIITGTGAYTVFSYAAPDVIEGLRQEYERQTGNKKFPSAEDMGKAAVNLVTEPHPSGYTAYVGNMQLKPAPSEQINPYVLNRDQIGARLPMYGRTQPYNKLYVDEFHSPAEDEYGNAKETGVGFYTVRRADTAGHFTGGYNDLRLYRGVDQIEMTAQVGGLVLIGLMDSNSQSVPLFTGADGIRWSRMAEPGDRLRIEARVLNMNPMKTKVAGEVYDVQFGKQVSEFDSLTFALAPNIDYVRRLKATQRSS